MSATELKEKIHQQIDLLTGWGGVLLYDSGIMAIVTIPVSRVKELAELESVLEII